MYYKNLQMVNYLIQFSSFQYQYILFQYFCCLHQVVMETLLIIHKIQQILILIQDNKQNWPYQYFFIQNVQLYLKDYWNAFDAIVIILSLVLLMSSLLYKDAQFLKISKILRTLFRFLRILFVFRRIKEIDQKEKGMGNNSDKTPVERILQIFNFLKDQMQQEKYGKDLQWAIEMVSTNKLYEPILEKGTSTNEIQQWMEQYNDDQKLSNKKNNDNIVNISSQNIEQSYKPNFQYEKMQIIQPYIQYFQELESREFSIFELFKENKGNELAYCLVYLFEQNDCFSYMHLNPEQLFLFGNRISQGYKDNPYHNKLHSLDVTQTMNFFIKRCLFKNVGGLNPLEIGTMYIAAAIHDLEHPGFNNLYQINMKTELAILYNDRSPLENHHISKTYRIINGEQDMNIFINLSKNKQKIVRNNIIQMIIATDMSYHFSDMAKLKGRTSTNDFNPKEIDKQLCMNTLLHACDISNPFKPFHIYQNWANRVLEEFWIQGDSERSNDLPISYLCDRYTTNIAKSQIGFIDFIVKPFYEVICLFLPEVIHYLSIFEQNKEEWQIYEDYYTKQLEILQKQRLEQLEIEKKIDEKNE
ncbi:hypothetical protein IMG5_026420 [Ichthyophthirius multifiliis]|uniref:Phosphodiesterase n=1 Tax=Ichthyophthirius multifiliis TaxID=5932 RepID=G0QL69_ICHMU|nr:hypothetical protein IMG5_026420 [Ichthyophthirius multifiliis]EGR34036.1 hypothetical protein IMG5_026420 [Ichthyophthirius multifiliis]|eukprot:XP_004039340.1 hypothetical protein IMG5_026420 [Ichthyophthirius multifiliis]